MDRRFGRVILAGTILLSLRTAQAEVRPELGRYKAHVATLASAEFGGRRGVGAAKSAFYVANELKHLGLEPLFGKSFIQAMPDRATGGTLGRNVGAKLVGSDPRLKEEWVIVSAHFDHLGGRGQEYYPGADDNASGTAMMLEVARCFAQERSRPLRSIMFVGFDREEDGLWGSRYFADHPPVPLDRVKLFVTADMIGRALGGVCKEFVFVFGADTSQGVRGRIQEAAKTEPIRVGFMGNDLLIVDRSDYGPFRSRSIPYLFLSTGENPDYHQRSDTSDTLDYPKALSVTRVVLSTIEKTANAENLPPWNGETEASLEEALAVRDVLRTLQENRVTLKIGGASLLVLNSTLSHLEGIVERGKITERERTRLVRAAMFLMTTVL